MPMHESEAAPTPTHCDWCGTKLRKGDAYPGMQYPAEVCPRGKMCRTEQKNHEDLLLKIKESK